MGRQVEKFVDHFSEGRIEEALGVFFSSPSSSLDSIQVETPFEYAVVNMAAALLYDSLKVFVASLESLIYLIEDDVKTLIKNEYFLEQLRFILSFCLPSKSLEPVPYREALLSSLHHKVLFSMEERERLTASVPMRQRALYRYLLNIAQERVSPLARRYSVLWEEGRKSLEAWPKNCFLGRITYAVAQKRQELSKMSRGEVPLLFCDSYDFDWHALLEEYRGKPALVVFATVASWQQSLSSEPLVAFMEEESHHLYILEKHPLSSYSLHSPWQFIQRFIPVLYTEDEVVSQYIDRLVEGFLHLYQAPLGVERLVAANVIWKLGQEVVEERRYRRMKVSRQHLFYGKRELVNYFPEKVRKETSELQGKVHLVHYLSLDDPYSYREHLEQVLSYDSERYRSTVCLTDSGPPRRYEYPIIGSHQINKDESVGIIRSLQEKGIEYYLESGARIYEDSIAYWRDTFMRVQGSYALFYSATPLHALLARHIKQPTVFLGIQEMPSCGSYDQLVANYPSQQGNIIRKMPCLPHIQESKKEGYHLARHKRTLLSVFPTAEGDYALFEAVARILLAVPDTIYMMIGPQKQKGYLSLFEKCGLGHRVTWRPWLENYFSLFSQAALYLHSFCVNRASLVLEAMSEGCPVLTLQEQDNEAAHIYGWGAAVAYEEYVAHATAFLQDKEAYQERKRYVASRFQDLEQSRSEECTFFPDQTVASEENTLANV